MTRNATTLKSLRIIFCPHTPCHSTERQCSFFATGGVLLINIIDNIYIMNINILVYNGTVIPTFDAH